MNGLQMAQTVLSYTSPNGTYYLAGGNDANCTVSVCHIDLSIYGYRPSIGASGTFIALYAVCMIVQIVLRWRYRTWGFMAAMVLGCVDEILGYAGRILLWQNPWGHSGFIMQIGEFNIPVDSFQCLTLSQSASLSGPSSSLLLYM